MKSKTCNKRGSGSAVQWASGIAAAATGGLVASSSQASIVYTPLSGTFVNGANPTVTIDFDNDGAPEGHIDYSSLTGLTFGNQSTKLSVLVDSAATNNAAVVPFGETIGPVAPTGDTYDSIGNPGGVPVILNTGSGSGDFTPASPTAYIGLQLGLSSSPTDSIGFTTMTNYAWIGFNVTDDSSPGSLTGQITGFAYQTDDGVPIQAGATVPEPTSLGLLALGAVGLGAYRRRAGCAPV